MKKRWSATAGILLFAVLCRISEPFAALWLRGFIQPASRLLASVSARITFPLIEALFFSMAVYAAVVLLRLPIYCLRLRSKSVIQDAFVRLLRPIAAILAGCILMWYPAYFAAPAPQRNLTHAQTEALCRTLIRKLNKSDLRFSPLESALETAVSAASGEAGFPLPSGAVKAARYPEWMDLFGLSGLYSPLTAEAIIHPRIAPGMRIFTAVHELMHLLGVADEGQANIRAWEACRRAGGEAEVSADLSALFYAMQSLRTADPDLWHTCISEMSLELRSAFSAIGGFSPPPAPPSPFLNGILALAGLREATSDYYALVPHLAGAFSLAD